MKTYIWAVDAGHEWLAVKKKELVELGIAHKISGYSYEKGATAYLEGDCDAAHFFDAYKAKHGVEPKTKQGKHWDRQPCRSFASYTPPTVTPGPILEETMATPGDTLTNYVNRMNEWAAIVGHPNQVNFPLDAQTAQLIGDKIDGELSPENLHCDGEISNAEAMRKYNFLTGVLDELNIYCDANSITRPTVYEA
jgi:hypothetical protein